MYGRQHLEPILEDEDIVDGTTACPPCPSPSSPRPSLPQPSPRAPSPDTATDPEDGNLSTRSLPQWKRQLMMEAPPGIFGPALTPRVAVTLSKAERQRELARLVSANSPDISRLLLGEHSRRVRARLRLYFTLTDLNSLYDRRRAGNTVP